MSIETRVETLEHEFKILKNEIERTLLEIQNQVLVHYYPSLRAEDIAPPKDLLPLLESAFTEAEDELAEKRANHETEDDEPAESLPNTKEVSLTEIKSKPKKLPKLPPKAALPVKAEAVPVKVAGTPAKGKTLQWPEETIEQAHLPLLAKWVNESVEKIGKALTQNMVESSGDAAQISPEVMNLLLQFITLCDEENPPEQIDTKELMEVLLKLDKMLSQLAKVMDATAQETEEHHG